MAVLLAASISGCGGGNTAATTNAARPKPTKSGLGIEHVGKFDEPIYVTQAGDDPALFVLERRGVVLRVTDAGERTKFLDIHRDVSLEGEGAASSIAFPPDYLQSGLMYISYAGKDKAYHLDEFRVGSNAVADPATRRSVLTIPHPEIIHWGGLAIFGPGGHLYIGTGDGGPDSPIPVLAQDTDSLSGKILRIDPEAKGPGERPYTVPKDNPLVGKPGADEIYSYGLRNPWRFSFDSKTGDLWIGDVGDYTREEVDHATLKDAAGANFGWPILEGDVKKSGEEVPSGLTPPALTYKRTGATDDPVCAVTGGYVERDPSVPKLDGQYIYADFCAGNVLSVPVDDPHPEPTETGLHVPRLDSFGEDASGHIYVTSLNGQVFRIVER